MGMLYQSPSYFMRRTTLSSEEYDEDVALVYIKIPANILMPDLDQCIILGVLDGYYAVDTYILVDSCEEDMMEYGKFNLVPFGIAANITLLITRRYEDGVEEIMGLITPLGEFALGFFDGNQTVAPILDEYVAEELGLSLSEEILELHNDFLKSIECDDDERVYIPKKLYCI